MAQALSIPSRICAECQGRGWLVKADGWPTECDACCPTKLVKGKTVLDVTRIKARALHAPAPKTYTPMRAIYHGAGTTMYISPDD